MDSPPVCRAMRHSGNQTGRPGRIGGFMVTSLQSSIYTTVSMRKVTHTSAISLLVASLLLVLLLVSCATAPSHDSRGVQDAEIKSDVIVRSRRSGELFADGELIGSIEEGTPSRFSLSPGAHVISIAPAEGAEEFIRITLEAGESRELHFRFGDDASQLIEPETLSGSMVLRLPRGVYRGDVRDGVPHGSGSLTSDEGDRYEGTWRDGLRYGRGTMEWADGSSYTGQWQTGEMHGEGTLTTEAGEIYRGEFREGEFHGEGEYVWSDGARYYGEWQQGDRHGVGYMEWSDGDYYEGEWRADEPEGSGLIIWNDGSRYEGGWVSGEPEGFGFYTEPDGLRYEGTFEAGLAVGGVLTVPTGEKYWATMSESGEWEWEHPIEEDSEDRGR